MPLPQTARLAAITLAVLALAAPLTAQAANESDTAYSKASCNASFHAGCQQTSTNTTTQATTLSAPNPAPLPAAGSSLLGLASGIGAGALLWRRRRAAST